MENKYQNMMDEVRAPEGLRESVMNISGQERTKKTRPIPARVLMVAACICALLVVGAVAAETLGFDFVNMFKSEQGDGYQTDGYRMDASEVKDIPISAFSQAIQDLEEQYKDAGGHIEYLTFDSWEEAEEYLGYNIIDNPVLAPGEYVPTERRFTEKGMTVSGNCVVTISIGQDGKISMIQATSHIRGRTIGMRGGVTVTAIIDVGDLPDQTDATDYTYGFNPEFFAVEEPESYLAANGLETVIVGVKRVSVLEGSGHYYANFFLRGIRFNIDTGYNAGGQETALAELKQVLDAFE